MKKGVGYQDCGGGWLFVEFWFVLRYLFFNSDLISFQMDSCRIAMASAGDHGYWSPTLTIILSAFNIRDVNDLFNSLILVKSSEVIEFVLSLA